jgi:hypothetical protein
MRDLLTGDDLYAEILLLRDENKAVVVVEGPDDIDSLDAHISEDSCYLIPGYGKDSVEYAIRLVDQKGPTKVLAILDRDWVGILDVGLESANIVYTDLYDLDATIMSLGNICKRVASSFCDNDRLKRHMSRTGASGIAEFAVRSSVAVGALRLIARERRLPLSVRDFPIGEIIDADGGDPDLRQLVTIAAAKAGRNVSIDVESTIGLVDEKVREIGYQIRYCSGHDLAEALSAVMRKRWGSSVRAAVVIKALRSALSCHDLSTTRMFGEVQVWAASQRVEVWDCFMANLDASKDDIGRN